MAILTLLISTVWPNKGEFRLIPAIRKKVIMHNLEMFIAPVEITFNFQLKLCHHRVVLQWVRQPGHQISVKQMEYQLIRKENYNG
jgi:hypothetical protein